MIIVFFVYVRSQTRVCRESIFGGNFHIFHQLLTGAGTNLLKLLKLKRIAQSYTLLRTDSGSSSPEVNSLIEDFRRTRTGLQQLGFSSNEIIELFQILAFILKLGNVHFLRKANIDSTEGCTILADYGKYFALYSEKRERN